MIIGIGIDIVDENYIKKIAKQRNIKFLKRVFTSTEIERSKSKANYHKSLAMIFSVKEAFLKALGTGWSGGIKWRDINVVKGANNGLGVELDGVAKKITSKQEVNNITISTTSSSEYTIAHVILENLT